MSRRRYNWLEAVDHIEKSCDNLAVFIGQLGGKRLPVRNEGSPFIALSRAIAYQQLSGKAAGTIHGRFLDLFPERQPSPERTLALPVSALRGVGLSQAKTLSIIDLAEKWLTGELPSAWKMARMADHEVTTCLCSVRGIGPWTAQMYLIFNMGRPDIMPATDLAIQKGVQNIYRMRKLPSPDQVMTRTKHLAPFRSVASWYFWRASELPA